MTDPDSGTTYIGGHFTEIGVKSGAVAVVDPPDVGDGALRSPSPEIIGRVDHVFADDRPGDPGFFIVGRVTAIDGVAVGQRPVHRMHLVSGRWVLDTSWVVPAGCHTGNANFPADAVWIATPKYLVGGGFAGSAANGPNTTGITLIERATGIRRVLGPIGCSTTPKLFPSIPALPDLAGCGSATHCYAPVGDLAYDPTTQHLIVHYGYVVGSGNPESWDGVVAYDLTPTTGGRAWVRDLEHGPPPGPPGRRAIVGAVGAVPGAFLVRGFLPLEADLGSDADATSTMLLDAETGLIERRWDGFGEEDPATGSSIGPADGCLTSRSAWQSELVANPLGTFGWTDSTLCRYGVSGGAFDAETVGSYALTPGNALRLPTTYHAPATGERYLLGSSSAIDLDSAELVDWDPDPAVFTTDPRPPSVASVAGAAIVGGPFTFVRGRPSPGVAALDSAMVPITAFTSPLRDPTNDEGVHDLALSEGRLLVGGSYLLPSGVGSIVAVDPATGALDPWQADDSDPVIVDDIVVEPDGDFWIAGFSDIDAPAASIQRYASIDTGGALQASPIIECLDAPLLDGFGSSEPFCQPEWAQRTRVYSIALAPDGSLYFAGVFGRVDGVPRRGLARLAPDGSVSAWDPDLVGAFPLTPGRGIREMATHAMVLLGDRVAIGGEYGFIERKPNGSGGTLTRLSPLLIFSATSGGLILPTDPQRGPWFPHELPTIEGPVYDLAHTDAGLFAALGEEGIGIFDATTFDFDEAASVAFINPDWWSRSPGNAVFVLSTPPPGQGSSGVSIAAASGPDQMIIGGSLTRWQNRLAGNVLRAAVGADTRAPSVSSMAATIQTSRAQTTSALSARISWKGADPGGSGVKRYEVAMSTGGGSYSTVSTASNNPAWYATVRPWRTYRFRVRPIDFAGNVGAWVYGRPFTPAIVQQSSSAVRYSGGWKTYSGAGYLGGSTRITGVKGSSATFTFTGQAISLVSTKTRTRGKVRIYVDGRFQSDINLYSSSTLYRQSVWSKSWSSSARHTIKLVVLGTSGHPTVDIDALVVFR